MLMYCVFCEIPLNKLTVNFIVISLYFDWAVITNAVVVISNYINIVRHFEDYDHSKKTY